MLLIRGSTSLGISDELEESGLESEIDELDGGEVSYQNLMSLRRTVSYHDSFVFVLSSNPYSTTDISHYFVECGYHHGLSIMFSSCSIYALGVERMSAQKRRGMVWMEATTSQDSR